MKNTSIISIFMGMVLSTAAYAQEPQEQQTIQPTAEVKSNGFTLNPITKTLIFDLKVSPYFNLSEAKKYDQLTDVNIPKLTFTDLEASAFQLITPNLLGGDTSKSFNAYVRNLKKQQMYVGLEMGSILRKPILTMNQTYDTLSTLSPGAITFYYSQKISDMNTAGHGVQVYAKVKLMPMLSVEDEHGNVPHVMRDDEVASVLTEYCNSNPECTLVSDSDQEHIGQFASIEAGIKTSKVAIGFDLEYMNLSPLTPSTAMYNHATGTRTFVTTRRAMETYSMQANFDYTLWKDKDLGKLTLGVFGGADMTVDMTSTRTNALVPHGSEILGAVPGAPTMSSSVYPPPAESSALSAAAQAGTGTQKVVAPFIGLTAKYEFGNEGASVRKKRNHYSEYKGGGKKFSHKNKKMDLISSTQGNPLNPFKKFFRWIGNIGQPRH